MTDDYHQISAFVAAKEHDKLCNVAYAVYDNGELLVTRSVSMQTNKHRGLLMATWSAVSWCKANIPQHPLSVYSNEKRTGNELSAVWMGKDPKDFEDSDRIESIINDCCFVCQVAFGYVGTDEQGILKDYSRRMRELIEVVK